MESLLNFIGYVKAGNEGNDASKKLTAIKKLLEEGETIAKRLETGFTALTQAVRSQIEANDKHEKDLQHGLERSQIERGFADEACENILGGMRDAIQMNNDWIKKLHEQIDEPFKLDSATRNNALEQEKRMPAQCISELRKDYKANTSGEDKAMVKIRKDSSSRKKAGLAEKRQVVSLLYCPQKLDLVTSVMKNLDEMLITHLSTHGIDLKMQICETVQDIREDIPLIVICLHSSRLGTDVTNALRGIRTGPNVAVMVLHYKDSHALPHTSSEKILTGQEFQRVGAIVDMGFLSQKGFYTCDVNSKAIKALTLFITGHKSM